MGIIKSIFEKWACKHEWKVWDRVNMRDDFGEIIYSHLFYL